MVIEVKHVLAYDVDRRKNKPLCQTADEETVYTWLSATKDVNCPECLRRYRSVEHGSQST
jgi:hypothetical protein